MSVFTKVLTRRRGQEGPAAGRAGPADRRPRARDAGPERRRPGRTRRWSSGSASSRARRLDDLLIESYAVVREAAWRVLGQRHFDVQLMGGMALHFGWIAEMKTGEGKTLVSTLPGLPQRPRRARRARGHGQRLPGHP